MERTLNKTKNRPGASPAAQNEKGTAMNYRDFGRTGEKISALGFGCMRFPEVEKDGARFVDQDKVDEMISCAYENGVNYFVLICVSGFAEPPVIVSTKEMVSRLFLLAAK